MKTFNQIFGASLPTSEDDRKEFLANNCNHVAKEVGYSKAFTSVEVEKKRYELEKVSIYLEDKEEEKKEFNANWKDIIANCIGDILNRFPKLAMIYKQ